MNEGRTASSEAADIALLGGDLEQVRQALRIARETAFLQEGIDVLVIANVFKNTNLRLSVPEGCGEVANRPAARLLGEAPLIGSGQFVAEQHQIFEPTSNAEVTGVI